jgi:hypothetical protein
VPLAAGIAPRRRSADAAPTQRRPGARRAAAAPRARAGPPRAPHLDQRHEVVDDARVRQLLADLAQRLDRAVAHDGLLHLRQVLQRRQQRVRVDGAADVGHKLAQLLRHGQQHLILVVVGLCQEGDELRARALLAQREGDGAQPLDGVQAPHRLVVLELVSAGGGRRRRRRAGGAREPAGGGPRPSRPHALHPHQDGDRQEPVPRPRRRHGGAAGRAGAAEGAFSTVSDHLVEMGWEGGAWVGDGTCARYGHRRRSGGGLAATGRSAAGGSRAREHAAWQSPAPHRRPATPIPSLPPTAPAYSAMRGHTRGAAAAAVAGRGARPGRAPLAGAAGAGAALRGGPAAAARPGAGARCHACAPHAAGAPHAPGVAPRQRGAPACAARAPPRRARLLVACRASEHARGGRWGWGWQRRWRRRRRPAPGLSAAGAHGTRRRARSSAHEPTRGRASPAAHLPYRSRPPLPPDRPV